MEISKLAPLYGRMISRHRTQVFFWSAVALSLVSIALVIVLPLGFLLLLLASVVFNIGCLVKSEQTGFVKTSQMRRAYEPARHFNTAQVFVLFGLIIVQVVFGAYLLIEHLR